MYRKTAQVLILIAFVLSACNLPGGQGDSGETDDLVLTITAQAAIIQPGGGDPNQGQQPGVPAATATLELTATPEGSATPSVPQVTVTTDTNCRTGPGTAYDIIGALLIGQVGTVVGKNSSTGYWIINNPGRTGTCWLYPQYATVTGNTANLQEYTIPPTPTPTKTSTPLPTSTFTPSPTPAAPAPAASVSVTKNCIMIIPAPPTFMYNGTLTWQDNSNNEDGFNIYFNGALQATLPANSTSYPIPPLPFPAGTPEVWGVEAFNAAGKATITITNFICP